jgi:hypothetical protein
LSQRFSCDYHVIFIFDAFECEHEESGYQTNGVIPVSRPK